MMLWKHQRYVGYKIDPVCLSASVPVICDLGMVCKEGSELSVRYQEKS